ncbi:MAG: hypothetical protein HZB56_23100 [Deltaproteobacteria bacterium]|nr:hypothetical protein [Deltaproteobacteria bacterium]
MSQPNASPDHPGNTLPMPRPPRREIQELWLALARRPWRSAVLVPVDPAGSAAIVAASLAEVGRRLRLGQVSAVVASRLDYEDAAQMVRRLEGLRGGVASDPLVVAIPSVVAEPLGVAVAREADLVVLCIELGQSSLAAARRTIELIGSDRIAGCLLLG